jgi:hypothetical protein
MSTNFAMRTTTSKTKRLTHAAIYLPLLSRFILRIANPSRTLFLAHSIASDSDSCSATRQQICSLGNTAQYQAFPQKSLVFTLMVQSSR